MYIALIIILIGVLFLLKNLGVIAGDLWPILWPVLVILLGVSILSKVLAFHRRWGWLEEIARRLRRRK